MNSQIISDFLKTIALLMHEPKIVLLGWGNFNHGQNWSFREEEHFKILERAKEKLKDGRQLHLTQIYMHIPQG